MKSNNLPQRFFGIDLAKRVSQLCVLDQDANVLSQKRFPTTAVEFSKIASELNDKDTVAFEMTTNAFAVARLFTKQSEARVIVSNPMKTKLIAASKNKTDKIDARVLADLARVDYLPEVWIPDEECESLRRLTSRRRNLVKRQTMVKNDVHSILHRNLVEYQLSDLFGKQGLEFLDLASSALPALEAGLIEDYRDELSDIASRIKHAEARIAAFICSSPELLRQADLLLTIEGFNITTTAAVLASIGDISRFKSKQKLASYFGLTPSNFQSGDSRTFHGSITKQGRSDARWALSNAAEAFIRTPSPMQHLFFRVSKKKNHNVAKIAVARKLAELVFTILKSGQPYLYQKHRLTQEKQANLRKLAKGFDVETKSASPTNMKAEKAIKGLNLKSQGRQLKDKISRDAAIRATSIFTAVFKDRSKEAKLNGFNPFQPTQHDYESLLKDVIRDLLKDKLPADKN